MIEDTEQKDKPSLGNVIILILLILGGAFAAIYGVHYSRQLNACCKSLGYDKISVATNDYFYCYSLNGSGQIQTLNQSSFVVTAKSCGATWW